MLSSIFGSPSDDPPQESSPLKTVTTSMDSVRNSISSAGKKAARYVGVADEEEQEPTITEELSSICPSLTYKQRMYGFGICFVLGWFLEFLSILTLSEIRTNPGRFALTYTLGSIVALASTCFLWGPMRQLKKMFKPIRAGATILYLLSMILTLYLAFSHAPTMSVLLAILLQFLAMVWYVLSYIPYARRAIRNCLCG